MQIEINKKKLDELRNQGVGVTAYLFLLSLYHNEDLFSDTDLDVYKNSQNLIIGGWIIEDFSESDDLFLLTDRGRKLIETIQNQ